MSDAVLEGVAPSRVEDLSGWACSPWSAAGSIAPRASSRSRSWWRARRTPCSRAGSAAATAMRRSTPKASCSRRGSTACSTSTPRVGSAALRGRRQPGRDPRGLPAARLVLPGHAGEQAREHRRRHRGSDVHGKNHHASGSTAASVEDFRMILASGELVTCSRHGEPGSLLGDPRRHGPHGHDRRGAPAPAPGGDGLDARRDQTRARDLDALLSLNEDDEKWEYAVAWIDCLAARAARWAARCCCAPTTRPAASSRGAAAAAPLEPPKPFRPEACRFMLPSRPVELVHRRGSSTRAIYRVHREGERLQACDGFFYRARLGVEGWNRIYGSARPAPVSGLPARGDGPRGAGGAARGLLERRSARRSWP